MGMLNKICACLVMQDDCKYNLFRRIKVFFLFSSITSLLLTLILSLFQQYFISQCKTIAYNKLFVKQVQYSLFYIKNQFT